MLLACKTILPISGYSQIVDTYRMPSMRPIDGIGIKNAIPMNEKIADLKGNIDDIDGAYKITNSDTTIRTVWIYPNNEVGQAQRHEKVELGLYVPKKIQDDIDTFFDMQKKGPNELNPYNRHDIDITVSIFKDGVHEQDVDAFYYREYTPNRQNKYWRLVPNECNWRVRFAPRSYGGKWFAAITIKARNHKLYQAIIPFTVNDSDNPGYLEIGKHKKFLRSSYDKKSFFGIGQSLTWAAKKNGNYNYSSANLTEFFEFHAVVKKFVENGGNFCRINSISVGHDFELEALNNYDTRQQIAWDFDRVVDYLELNNVYMMFVIKHHEHWYPRKPGWDGWLGERWNENPYNSKDEFMRDKFPEESIQGVDAPIDFFTSPQALDYFKNYMRYVQSRWGYSTSVAAWQVFSEIDLIADYHYKQENRDIIHEFLREVSIYVKDSLKAPQLYSVALGGAASGNHRIEDAGVFEIPKHDFTGVHLYNFDYPNSVMKYPDRIRTRNVWARAKTAKEFMTGGTDVDEKTNNYHPQLLDKPFLFDEFGTGPQITGLVRPTDDPIQDFIDCTPEVFHNDLWASACMGGMSTGLDWWYCKSQDNLQATYKGITSFFKDIDFESHNFYSVADAYEFQRIAQAYPSRKIINRTCIYDKGKDYRVNDKVEAFTMIEDNAERAYGWVHNRSHYYWNIYASDTTSCLYPLIKDGYVERPEDDDVVDTPINILGKDNNTSKRKDRAFFKIENMKKSSNYTVQFFNTRSGELVHQIEEKSSMTGKLKIWAPDMIPGEHPDLAYKIFIDSW